MLHDFRCGLSLVVCGDCLLRVVLFAVYSCLSVACWLGGLPFLLGLWIDFGFNSVDVFRCSVGCVVVLA